MNDQPAAWRDAPQRPNDLPAMDLRVRHGEDGSVYLRHGQALDDFAPLFSAHLQRQAREQPDKIAYARRESGGAVASAPWRSVTYAQLLDRVQRIAG